MTNGTISEKCETLYNKLNSFVTSVISRDVTPKISNLNTEVWGSNTQTGDSRIDTLESDVNSLDTSITNLIKVQGINTGYTSCYSLYSVDKTATVTACPSGYSVLFIPQNGYRSVTRFSGLSGTTATFQVTNINTATQNVNAQGWLVYYPSTWDI